MSLNRRRIFSICFLFPTSLSIRFSSGSGISSDMHLASLVMVSQRRATSRGLSRAAISGRVRSTACRWLLSSARNSTSMVNSCAQLFFAADDPVAAVCVICSAGGIEATEKGVADAACGAVEDSFAGAAQEFTPSISDHWTIPPCIGSVAASQLGRLRHAVSSHTARK